MWKKVAEQPSLPQEGSCTPSTVARLCGTTEKETEDTVCIPLGYVPYSRMIKVCRLTLITIGCWEFILCKVQYMSGMF